MTAAHFTPFCKAHKAKIPVYAVEEIALLTFSTINMILDHTFITLNLSWTRVLLTGGAQILLVYEAGEFGNDRKPNWRSLGSWKTGSLAIFLFNLENMPFTTHYLILLRHSTDAIVKAFALMVLLNISEAQSIWHFWKIGNTIDNALNFESHWRSELMLL